MVLKPQLCDQLKVNEQARSVRPHFQFQLDGAHVLRVGRDCSGQLLCIPLSLERNWYKMVGLHHNAPSGIDICCRLGTGERASAVGLWHPKTWGIATLQWCSDPFPSKIE